MGKEGSLCSEFELWELSQNDGLEMFYKDSSQVVPPFSSWDAKDDLLVITKEDVFLSTKEDVFLSTNKNK